MKLVLQRVKTASVRVDGQTIAEIGPGLLVLLGVAKGDGEAEAAQLARKIAELRVFEDDAGKMNRSVRDVGGSILAVSQFTLCADCRKGRRPSFDSAAAPEEAERLYDRFVQQLASHGVPVQTGQFAAMMDVALVNDGPVTLVLDSAPVTD